MSRELPEWIGADDDTPIPDRVKLRVFLKFDGRCQGQCGNRKLTSKDKPQTDHIIAIANGGQNREMNLQPLCLACHKIKTKRDVAEKSRVYQRQLSNAGIRQKRSSFPGWRKFNGEAVRNPRAVRGR